MEQQLLIESRTRRGKKSDLSPWKLVFREKLIKICVMNEREIETFILFFHDSCSSLDTFLRLCKQKFTVSAPVVYYFSFVVVQSSVESFPVFLF